ncbi:hypothetical protein KA107_01475 [Candidatus Pacearchaeota archaeon]|nr:hypothetical protein [Candidatus Pacearchaeota archaeon]
MAITAYDLKLMEFGYVPPSIRFRNFLNRIVKTGRAIKKGYQLTRAASQATYKYCAQKTEQVNKYAAPKIEAAWKEIKPEIEQVWKDVKPELIQIGKDVLRMAYEGTSAIKEKYQTMRTEAMQKRQEKNQRQNLIRALCNEGTLGYANVGSTNYYDSSAINSIPPAQYANPLGTLRDISGLEARFRATHEPKPRIAITSKKNPLTLKPFHTPVIDPVTNCFEYSTTPLMEQIYLGESIDVPYSNQPYATNTETKTIVLPPTVRKNRFLTDLIREEY